MPTFTVETAEKTKITVATPPGTGVVVATSPPGGGHGEEVRLRTTHADEERWQEWQKWSDEEDGLVEKAPALVEKAPAQATEEEWQKWIQSAAAKDMHFYVVWSVPGEFAWDGVGVQPSSGMQKGIYLTTWKQITSFFKGESFFHTGIKLKKINIAAHGPLAQKSRSIRMAAVEEWQKHAHKKGEDGAAQQSSFDGAYFVDKKLMEPEGEERWPEPPAAQPRQPGIYIVG